MSWIKKAIKKIINLVKGVTGAAAAVSNPPIPAPTPAAGMGNLPAGVLRSLERSFDDRNSGEIDANRSSAAPLPSKILSDTLAEEYDSWFKTLHAGIMSPQPQGLAALKSSLRVYNFATWGAAFTAYWTAVIWLPSGVYTGGVTTNAPAQGVALQNEINTILRSEFTSSKNKTVEDFADRIAGALHTYTTKLTVQATLSVPPNTKVETVM